jgi:YD repeat-containing protein
MTNISSGSEEANQFDSVMGFPPCHMSPSLFDSLFSYNTSGQIAATVNPLGNRITHLFDTTNRLAAFLFDAVGRDTGSIDPLARRVTMGYDAAGNRLFKFDPRGNRVTYNV